MLLQTERLIIRPFRPDDEAGAIELFMDPGFMVWSLDPPHSRDSARAKLQGFIDLHQAHGFSKLAVIARDGRSLLGYCGFALEPIEGPPAPELGFRLHPDARGKGFATEAARAVVEDAIARLDMPFVQAIVAEKNAASRRVLEKLGMNYRRNLMLHGHEWMLYRLDVPCLAAESAGGAPRTERRA